MTLTTASSIAFAVAGGLPADAREWITVDMAGHPTSGRRGYLVTTEPVGQTGRGHELAAQAREIIVRELRRLQRVSPDEALGRALAAANGAIYEQTRGALLAGADQRVLVGATAVIFENHIATIAHVPPGQLILVEDGLVYSVPSLESWFPHYAQNGDSSSQPEPLGYASWTSPVIAQTELRPGDTIVACSSETGQAFAEEVVTSGFTLRDLTYLHRRDPELVLDAFRGVVIARDLSRAAAAVVSFPPLPDGAQINTLADVGRRVRERWRHGRVTISRWRPVGASRRRAAAATSGPGPAALATGVAVGGAPASIQPVVAPANGVAQRRVRRNQERTDRLGQRLEKAQARMQHMADWGGPKWRSTWTRPSPTSEFGVPGAHGVNMFRGQSTYMGEASWRNRLPRLPVIGSNWIWPALLVLVVGSILGASLIRDRWFVQEVDEAAIVASIDEDILVAQSPGEDEAIANRLAIAQRDLDAARSAGVSEDILGPRQQAITEQLDGVTSVLRVSDLQRIGTLPAEFNQTSVRGIYTPAGIFFVAGNLYQWRPGEQGDPRAIDVILKQGDTVGAVTVGSLWGLAFDAKGLYVTDGQYVYMLADGQQWRAVQLGRINNQPWKPGPMAAFDGSIYLLQPEYLQIYRFGVAAATDVVEPRDWLQAGARDDIDTSRDIAIDGRIYVLLRNGRVLLMYQGQVQSDLQPHYVETGDAASLVNGTATGYTYIAVTDGENSRIVAFDQLGTTAYQLKLPIGFSTGDVNVKAPFDGLQDVIFDESTGTIFIINGDAIWTARYSLPPLPTRDTSTPEPGQ